MIQDTDLSKFSKFTFSSDIFPIYKKHEETFDFDGIHGILHIGRSVIAAYVLWKETKKFDENIYLPAILIACAFHDSGRESNGEDLWVSNSAQNCKNWLEENWQSGKWYDYNTPYFRNLSSSLILKNDSTTDLNAICVYNSDVLEIMRPCTGRGGRYGFIKEKLIGYYSMKEFYDSLIKEWWVFISMTEPLKKVISTPDCIEELIKIISDYRDLMPTIYNAIKK